MKDNPNDKYWKALLQRAINAHAKAVRQAKDDGVKTATHFRFSVTGGRYSFKDQTLSAKDKLRIVLSAAEAVHKDLATYQRRHAGLRRRTRS